MGAPNVQRRTDKLWRLVRLQHGVIARWQLLELGFSAKAIRHRLANGRLHAVYRGVYAVGRPELTQKGRWMAAVLACGPGAVLSHLSAAVLWGIRPRQGTQIEITVHATRNPRVRGLKIHRRAAVATTQKDGIAVTTPIQTIVDLAARLDRRGLEAMINEADLQDLVHPAELRTALDEMPRQPGVKPLRELLDRQTFRLTRSDLERFFLPIAERAGLPVPETCVYVNDFEVDFYWAELGLVVEADGGRFHRTAAQQTRDRVRDQTHAVAGLTPLRFTHAQIAFERDHVQATLAAVSDALRQKR